MDTESIAVADSLANRVARGDSATILVTDARSRTVKPEDRDIANDYYTEAFAGVPHGLAKSEQIVESLQAIEAAFDKLPRLRAFLEDRVTAAVATGGPVSYVVMLAHPPRMYVDGMALNVRFPVTNAALPTLDVVGVDGSALGAKPIRQVDGSNLDAGHIAMNARAELYYVDVGGGYWTVGAGARGPQGIPGPPDGTFSLNTDKHLVFTASDGVTDPTNLGPVAPVFQGDYDAAETYSFLHMVRAGGRLYLHVGPTDTTGTAVTDASVWQQYSRDGNDAGIVFEFEHDDDDGGPWLGRTSA